MEQWKTIEDFPNYEVSTFGNVKSKRRNKLRYTSKSKDGYLRMDMSVSGKSKKKLIHRLVALAFIDNPENKPFVDHIDHDRTNNNISNLRWATQKENQANAGMFSNNTTGFKGVCFDKRKGKYKAQISIQNKSTHLGCFKTPEEASAVYEKKAKELRGEFYCATTV
ncbi:hypothetical protein AURANDRAFT_33571 [Aureococcus anophagefferens]|uniref:AP2/ERF domain-containing protein n=1 Tax=Aureococcus anophagefferens TaxID=44056 RepID=F0YMB4_AURAN|nr:hypothetical protein AURANDRAFT_33571 [Aureococcus anophagefferens]EGB03757.1 hypothetical protein AURANDRAFT_33571 [Aureococcus anophagefferens]|eukprot:XP_009041542.1 hypothetical protein AURANDRAFT_33571 [Aureococcus anophagefferens]